MPVATRSQPVRPAGSRQRREHLNGQPGVRLAWALADPQASTAGLPDPAWPVSPARGICCWAHKIARSDFEQPKAGPLGAGGMPGVNTPWKRVRLTRGFGTSAANRAMKSSGSKITCVAPSRYGVLNWCRTLPFGVSDSHFSAIAGRLIYRHNRSSLHLPYTRRRRLESRRQIAKLSR